MTKFLAECPEYCFSIKIIAGVICFICNPLEVRRSCGSHFKIFKPLAVGSTSGPLVRFVIPFVTQFEVSGSSNASDALLLQIILEIYRTGIFRELIAEIHSFGTSVYSESASDYSQRCQIASI